MKNKKSLLTRIFAAMLSLSLIVPGGIVFAEENSENVQDTSTIAASVNEIEGQTVKESDADSLNQEDASDAASVADVEESEKNHSEEKSEDSDDELSQKEEKENTKDANNGAVEEIPVSTVTGLAALKIVGKWGQRPGGQWQVWN